MWKKVALGCRCLYRATKRQIDKRGGWVRTAAFGPRDGVRNRKKGVARQNLQAILAQNPFRLRLLSWCESILGPRNP